MQLVERVFAVLRTVSQDTDAADGATVTQIRLQTGLPKSTVSRILLTLEQLEMVERAPQGRGFKIGRGLIALVAHIPHAENLVALARPYLQMLHEATGETVALTLPEGDHAYVAAQINSDHAIQVRDWTGIRIPMYAQSSGRVFLAERNSSQLERYLAKTRTAYTAKTRTTPNQLRAMLADVRAQGYAWVSGEFEDGLTAVAAPVRDVLGKVIATVSIFGPSFRFPKTRQHRAVTRLIVDIAERFSARLQTIMPTQ
jgi:DNA-binding IclR family transcriptional regulator